MSTSTPSGCRRKKTYLNNSILVVAGSLTLLRCVTPPRSQSGRYELPFDLVIAAGTPARIPISEKDGIRSWASIVLRNIEQNVVSATWSIREKNVGERTIAMRDISTDFAPTAKCSSRAHSGIAYVAGWDGVHCTLEEWRFGVERVPGENGAIKYEETLSRRLIPLDSCMGPLKSVCANPWETDSVGERLWVFDWKSGEVDEIDPANGSRTVKLESRIASAYSSMSLQRHTFFGIVCRLDRLPSNAIRRSSRTVAEHEIDELIAFDQDCDGVIDGHFKVPVDPVKEHSVFASGKFVDGE